MISLSIRRKIMGIAVVLIALMAITAVLSMASIVQVGDQLDELTESYIPAYGNLARANIRSLERALELRRIIISKTRSQSDIAAMRAGFEAKSDEFESEIRGARKLIGGLIEQKAPSGDTLALARLQTRLDATVEDSRRHLNEEIGRLLPLLDTGDTRAVDDSLTRVDALRNELNNKLEAIRADMLVLLRAEADLTTQKQRRVTLIAAVLTLLATTLGLVFSSLVSAGVTRPVRRLLEGAKSVEAGHLEGKVPVTSKDEIGHLTAAFNQMVEQLRLKERIRETFGKYVDPRIVEGLIDRPVLAAEGQRRVMTVLFCDVKGFTSASEGMTPQGLVKVMNRYFSTMSAAIRDHEGIIDKYIGDAIMAYWGPPFTDQAEQTRLASLAALKMLELVPQLGIELPELLGVRSLPNSFDLRIGIATGDVLVGSIGSELMMSYTVMGDTVNLASRLEGANKEYGSRILASEATIAGASEAVEAREVDRVTVLGQNRPRSVFEIMGRKSELTPAQLELRDRFSEGLACYRSRRWDESRRAFEAALAIAPNDGPSATFINRLNKLTVDPPAEDWDGSWRLDRK
ncbi:MAG: adenylate/guanylate cyclase domain-containing protein [Rhizomicrobium sp.]